MHDDYLDGNLLFTYNKLNSLTKKVVDITTDNGGFYQEIDYTYETIANTQSDRIETVTVKSGKDANNITTTSSYTYTYDANGNITKVTQGSLILYQYAYDNLGQLTREDNYFLNKSYVYTYDDAGNITSKSEYNFTTGTLGTRRSYRQFTYTNTNWGDQLVGYNGTYYWVDYDEIGNPVRYGYGESDSDYMEDGYELTWDGRELVAFRQCSDFDSLTYVSNITYTYNADGIRTSKTVNGIKHEYYLSGSQIIAEVWVENDIEHTLIYIYDEAGSPIGLKYRTNEYDYDQFNTFFFEKNLQGDIIAVYNESGVRIGQYKYDAWGNHTVSVTSGVTLFERQIVNSYNPFRYRGYYYDVETKFYYLQSRYYNPEWCRFLNADVYIGTGGFIGYNMYAYCNNNPIKFCDPCGRCSHISSPDMDCSICYQAKKNAYLAGQEYEEPHIPPNNGLDIYHQFEDDDNVWAIPLANSSACVLISILSLTTTYDDIVKIFNMSGTSLDVLFFGLEFVINIETNYSNGSSAGKIIYDAGVDLGLFFASSAAVNYGVKLGSAIGSFASPAGTILGGIFGGTIGLVTYYFTDVCTYGTDKTLREMLKDWVD